MQVKLPAESCGTPKKKDYAFEIFFFISVVLHYSLIVNSISFVIHAKFGVTTKSRHLPQDLSLFGKN